MPASGCKNQDRRMESVQGRYVRHPGCIFFQAQRSPVSLTPERRAPGLQNLVIFECIDQDILKVRVVMQKSRWLTAESAESAEFQLFFPAISAGSAVN